MDLFAKATKETEKEGMLSISTCAQDSRRATQMRDTCGGIAP